MLEVNSAPSFRTDSPLDEQVKACVVGDTLGMLWKCGSKARQQYQQQNERLVQANGVINYQMIKEAVMKEKLEYMDSNRGD